jgi:hypothetical protein
MVRIALPASESVPVALTEVGSYSLPLTEQEIQNEWIFLSDVFVQRTREGRVLAYLAFWERGLQIVDVTDPAAPVRLGGVTLRAWTQAVWVEGQLAYVTEGNFRGAIRVFDVSSPSEPREVGTLRSSRGDGFAPRNVQVADGYVFATWFQDGLRVFQTSVAKPAGGEAAFFNTWDEADHRLEPLLHRFEGAVDLAVSHGQVYVSDQQTGLWILKLHPDGQVCDDELSGRSPFAREGRAPMGFSSVGPTAIRKNRDWPFYALVRSPDYYVAPFTEKIVADLGPSIELSGLQALTPTTVRQFGEVTRWYRVPATQPLGSVSLDVSLDDRGEPRRRTVAVSILEEAPPNSDTEPNNHGAVAARMQLDGTGKATFKGSLDWTVDAHDYWFFERAAGAAALVVKVAVPRHSQDPGSPGIRAVLNTNGDDVSTSNVVARAIVPYSDPANPQLAFEYQFQALSQTGMFFLGAVVNGDPSLRGAPYLVRIGPAP